MTVMIQSGPGSIVMDDVSWDYYTRTLEELGPSSGTKVIYDQGRMEIVTHSDKHERTKKIIARLLEMYAAEMEIQITPLGMLTMRRRKLARGLEPDECYFVQTPAPPTSEGEFNLSVNPPPDLAIEVEISETVISKIPIYAALKVKEVWRYAGGRIAVLHLNRKGEYQPKKKSLAFPKLDIQRFNKFVSQTSAEGDLKAIKALREWVQSTKGRAK